MDRLRRDAASSDDRQRRREASLDLSRFPLDDNGQREVRMPTRLGNLIYEYERYPFNKYGLDSVFFWHRIWLSVDKDVREHMDLQQAVVDGALYVCFALGVTSLFFSGYAVASLVGIRVEYVPAPGWCLALATIVLLLASGLYRASLHAHAQFGELFKAFFDQHQDKLAIEPAVEEVVRKTGDAGIAALSGRERNLAAWRYLRWHNVRLTGTSANVNVEDATKRMRGENSSPKNPR